MELPSTYKKKETAGKKNKSKPASSLKKDFFIIAVGLALVLLAFFLFGVISTLHPNIIFPRQTDALIGDDGIALDLENARVETDMAQGYVHMGVILGIVAFLFFVVAFVVLRWNKKENQ